MLNFILKLIFSVVVLAIMGVVTYAIGSAAIANAKAGAAGMGTSFGPMAALGILIISVILLAAGGDNNK